MYKYTLLILFILVVGCKKDPASSKELTVTDIDGNVYETVQIGEQLWMAENLKVKHYRNGDPINYITNEWWSNEGAYYSYNNNLGNSNTYGLLYNWYAVNDLRGIAPEGWRVATIYDWQNLVNYLGGNRATGAKMKATYDWDEPNTGVTNESGFTALPAGRFYVEEDAIGFSGLGWIAEFWSSNYWTLYDAQGVTLWYDESDLYFYNDNDKRNGYSVRCIKD